MREKKGEKSSSQGFEGNVRKYCTCSDFPSFLITQNLADIGNVTAFKPFLTDPTRRDAGLHRPSWQREQPTCLFSAYN